MKYLLALAIGLLLGAATGAALIYFNPMIMGASASPPAAGVSFDYALDGGRRVLVSTRDSVPGLPLTPARQPALWERGIRGSVLESVVLADDSGAAAAVATRLVVPSSASDAVRAGILTDDHWLITLPGRGSVIAAGQSNIWPLLRDSVVRVDLLKRPWEGAKRYSLLRGGGADVTGASGEYLGIRGVMSESVALDDYAQSGFAGLAGQIGIELGPID